MNSLRRALAVGTMCCVMGTMPHEAGAQNDRGSADAKNAQHGSHDSPPGLVQAVRDATRQFRDVEGAKAAFYGPFLGCVSGTQEGAMGVHYVNGGYAGDSLIEVDKPEALMYEMRNGRLQLLGVEYIVNAEAWNAQNDHPPTLMGQVFTYNGSPNRYGLDPFYALHVWAWRDNPNGAFVDWNPNVSCEAFVPDGQGASGW